MFWGIFYSMYSVQAILQTIIVMNDISILQNLVKHLEVHINFCYAYSCCGYESHIVCLHSCLHYLQTVTFNLWLLGLISWLISLSVCSFPAAAAESQSAMFSHLSESYQISEPIQLPCQTFHLENIYFNLIMENFPQIYSFLVYLYII